MQRINTDKLVKDLREVVDDAQELVKTTAGEAGERAQQARTRAERSLGAVRTRLEAFGERTGTRAKQAVHSAKGEIEQHPWIAIGATAVVGIVLGLLLRRK